MAATRSARSTRTPGTRSTAESVTSVSTTTARHPGPRHQAGARRGPGVLQRLWQHRVAALLVLPGLAVLLVFSYVPLFGNAIAFIDYSPYLGILHSPFVGLQNFRDVVVNRQFIHALLNTIEINVLILIFAFPAPIALAILLNGLIGNGVKRFVQTVIYLPHFMSWVVVVSLWLEMFGGAGLLNSALRSHGLPTVNIMGSPWFFKPLMTLEYIWKSTGWNTIVFFAALTTIDSEQYEQAAVDGATRWRQTWHITLPGLRGITVLLFILQLGNLLSVGFEQIFLQIPLVGQDAGNVISTYVYYQGVADGNLSYSTAAGFLQAVVAALLIYGANRVSKALGEDGLF